MSERNWRNGSVLMYGVIGILVLVGLLVGAREVGGQPVNFTPENPAAGSQDNTDPVVPEEFQDWTDVDQYLNQEGTQWYADCLSTRIGVSREQVAQYAQLVREGHDLRFILISNSTVSDEEARRRLQEQDVPSVEQLPIRRLNGFENTRGLSTDRCNPFGDDRSQVRVSLAIPVDPNDLSKGVDQNRGVLAMCGNPWKLPPEQPPVPPTSVPPGPPPTHRPPPTTPPTVPPTTPTTQPPVTTTTKPPQTDDCMLNGGQGCPPNDAVNPPEPSDDSTTPGAPPAERPPEDPDGGSGDGGAPPPTGPTDDSDADQVTEAPPPGEDPCPLGPGNCD